MKMGLTKTELFTERQNEIAIIAKAIAHPARVAIIEYLLKVDGCICNDIVDEINLAQPTVSQHLKELKTAGIIKGNIEGKAICYCLNENTIERLMSFFLGILNEIKDKRSNCCSFEN